MKHIITSIVVVVVLLAGGFYALNTYIYNEKQADVPVGETTEYTGSIVAIDTTQAMVDGPVLITLQAAEGVPVTVAVPSMGLPLCAAYKANNIGDVYLLKIGDEIEVRGALQNGAIVPCESADHYLRPTPLVVEDFEGEADPSRMTLTMKKWEWMSALYNDGREVKPKQPGKFGITFMDEGRFSLSTDCNSMGGSYTVGADNRITFSQVLSTKMYCEGSQEDVFAGLIENTASYHFTSKGELILELKFDSGTVTFR